MNTKITLDYQINRLGFWSAILLVASGVISMFLPLDIPGGSTAEHADRVAWLSTNRGVFIAGWANQIVAMLCASGILFGIAWQISGKNPLRAIPTDNGGIRKYLSAPLKRTTEHPFLTGQLISGQVS